MINKESCDVLQSIVNDNAAIERVFEGMFVVARRVLGYTSVGNSSPFSLIYRYTSSDDFNEKDARFIRHGLVRLLASRYPHKNHAHTDLNSRIIYVGMTSADERSSDGIVSQAIRRQGSDFNAPLVNTNLIAQALFESYFADMVVFARMHARYSEGWQEE
jgi:hypothetical protein